ncbi:Arc family DNA-binding protein [Halomonas sp. SSL-5]|uniref:Arc family DNA-binding protein n=1 Tax=Halomonas sp. SSL-5 TaxID=3065855 RepID=UPI00273848B7|nr:Arc family DNA-binding protein [Halomonas sp. SSL-5]MDY7116620.1 Arc family DNA-binding protein [Halomonas sp. SSL-5]
MRTHRTQIRIPGDLAEWIKQKACQEHRSMNAQLVHYLETQRKEEEQRDETATQK